MSRVERIDDAHEGPRRPSDARETAPNPRKISRTPGSAEGEERTIDEALENDHNSGARN